MQQISMKFKVMYMYLIYTKTVHSIYIFSCFPFNIICHFCIVNNLDTVIIWIER